MIAPRGVNMVRQPRGNYKEIPIAVSRMATPENKNKLTHWRRHPYARKYAQGIEVRLTNGSWEDAVHLSCDLPNTSRRLALGASNAICRTPHGASRLVQATFAWLAKTRRDPSRPSRDARVYGRRITAMHECRVHIRLPRRPHHRVHPAPPRAVSS